MDLTVNLHQTYGEIIFPEETKRDNAIIKFINAETGREVEILAHFSRIWLVDRPMNSTLYDWDLLKNHGNLNLRVHQVDGFHGFKYQVPGLINKILN